VQVQTTRENRSNQWFFSASQIGPNYFSVHGTEGMLGSWARSIISESEDAAALHATAQLQKKNEKGEDERAQNKKACKLLSMVYTYIQPKFHLEYRL
jgi:hypothetical protein